MNYSERHQSAISTKENLKDKSLISKFDGSDIQKNYKQHQFQNRKLDNRPPIVSQKPVLRHFEAQSKLKQLEAFNQENCDESSLEKKEQHAFTSSLGSLQKKYESSTEATKEQPEKSSSKCKPLEPCFGSSMILERIQQLKKNPIRNDAAEHSEAKECFITRKEAKGLDQINPELSKLKSATSDEDSGNHPWENPKVGIIQTLPRSSGQTNLYKLVALQNVTGRAPRKPARPPAVNLDFINKDAKAPGDRKSSNSLQRSRPISILTEEQENEEMRSFPGGKRDDRPMHQTMQGDEESEELYQELD